jgi:preprotein translocase subunit SecE
VARNRQRSKQRQAERRAKRLGEGGGPAGQPDDGQGRPADPEVGEPLVQDPRASEPAPGIDPELAVGAPPEDLGRSDEVLEDEPELDAIDGDGDAAEAAAADYAPRGRRGVDPGAPTSKGRGRVVQFLFAVWAELQRVQWPKRQALTTLTGVVIGFVIIAGGYLGLLDAIVSRIMESIL